MRMLTVIGIFLIISFPLYAQATKPDSPNFDAMDETSLRSLCKQQYSRIKILEAQIVLLKSTQIEKALPGDKPESKPEGGWVVLVTSNSDVPTGDLKSELDDLKNVLDGPDSYVSNGEFVMLSGMSLNRRISSARNVLGQRLGATKMVRGIATHVYSDSEIDASRKTLSDLESQKRKIAYRIGQLEEQIRSAEDTRVVEGKLVPGGSPVILKARGKLMPRAKEMAVGQTYVIDGSGSQQGVAFQIIPTIIVSAP